MSENVDRRILGAFRCVDPVLGTPLAERLKIASDALTLRPNASGVQVVFDAPGMRKLTSEFDVTDPWPAPQPFEVSITVLGNRYLSRRVKVRVPRALTPMTDPGSIQIPQDVPLYMSPAGSLVPGWAVVRVSVLRAGKRPGLPWTVVRLLRQSDNAVLATGMSDERGEALLAVAGLGVSASASDGGAVVQSTVDVIVSAVFDPSVLEHAGDWLPNPDDILDDLANPAFKTAAPPATIARGTDQSLELSITP